MPREYTVRVFAAPWLRRTLVRKPPLSFVAAKKCTQVSNKFIHFNYILFIFLFFSFLSIHIHTYIYINSFVRSKWGELRATSTCSSHPFPILFQQSSLASVLDILLLEFDIFVEAFYNSVSRRGIISLSGSWWHTTFKRIRTW